MSGTSAPRDDTGIGDTESNGSGRSDSDFADDVAPQNDTDLTSDGGSRAQGRRFGSRPWRFFRAAGVLR